MSDLLSGLHKDIASGNWVTNDLPSALAYNAALDDVAEALRNPTDEQADEVAAAEFALRMGVSPKGYYRMPKWYREGARDTARRWMAAAGGDE